MGVVTKVWLTKTGHGYGIPSSSLMSHEPKKLILHVMDFVLLGAKIKGSMFMSVDAIHLQDLGIPIFDSIFILSLQKLIVKCYQVNAKYKEAKNGRGVHAAMYEYAEEHQACYSLNRSKSHLV